MLDACVICCWRRCTWPVPKQASVSVGARTIPSYLRGSVSIAAPICAKRPVEYRADCKQTGIATVTSTLTPSFAVSETQERVVARLGHRKEERGLLYVGQDFLSGHQP